MKVFLVVFLIISVSCIEASVIVKRDAPNPVPGFEQVSAAVSKFTDMLSSGTQDLVKKFQIQELQTNAQTYFDQTKQQIEPLQAEFTKFLESLVAMAKSLGQQK